MDLHTFLNPGAPRVDAPSAMTRGAAATTGLQLAEDRSTDVLLHALAGAAVGSAFTWYLLSLHKDRR